MPALISSTPTLISLVSALVSIETCSMWATFLWISSMKPMKSVLRSGISRSGGNTCSGAPGATFSSKVLGSPSGSGFTFGFAVSSRYKSS